jgi:hypothetical protein
LVTLLRDTDFALLEHPGMPVLHDSLCHCPDSVPMLLNPLYISRHPLRPDPQIEGYSAQALRSLPLSCCACRQQIDLAGLGMHPVQLDMVVGQLDTWAHLYTALDHLRGWEYETWATTELTSLTSALNQRGLTICVDISEVRLCYYYLFVLNLEGSNCPQCQQPLVPYWGGEETNPRVCPACNIAADV